MKKAKPYAELVTQAEEATRAIKDPELRRVAFERVLDDLLADGDVAIQSQARSTRPAPRAPRSSLRFGPMRPTSTVNSLHSLRATHRPLGS